MPSLILTIRTVGYGRSNPKFRKASYIKILYLVIVNKLPNEKSRENFLAFSTINGM